MSAIRHRLRDAALPLAARLTRRPIGPAGDTILVFQPDHLGDIILAQPAVRAIKTAFPNTMLVAVVGPWSKAIARSAWPVDDVVTIAYPGFTRAPQRSTTAPYRQLRDDAARLRPFLGSRAVVLRADAWWVAWLASLVATTVVTSDDPRVTPFATTVVPVDAHAHAVARALQIAAGLVEDMEGDRSDPDAHSIELPFDPHASAQATSLLRAVLGEQPYVVIHPGSGAPVKEWPADRWRAVARRLVNDGRAVVLTGSHVECDMCNAIAEGCSQVISLAGKTSLPVLIEVMRMAAVVIGPDSGPLHIATAVKAPSVRLFGPSDPARFGPWGDPHLHTVLSAGWRCTRCGDLSLERGPGCGCMLAIDACSVITAARRVMRHDAPA
jgi:heptosyltransferase-2/heptosyltransferase-3